MNGNKKNAWTDAVRVISMKEKKQELIRRMNEEMKAIVNSPSEDVMQFRLGLLAKYAGELKAMNDKIQWYSCRRKRGA